MNKKIFRITIAILIVIITTFYANYYIKPMFFEYSVVKTELKEIARTDIIKLRRSLRKEHSPEKAMTILSDVLDCDLSNDNIRNVPKKFLKDSLNASYSNLELILDLKNSNFTIAYDLYLEKDGKSTYIKVNLDKSVSLSEDSKEQ